MQAWPRSGFVARVLGVQCRLGIFVRFSELKPSFRARLPVHQLSLEQVMSDTTFQIDRQDSIDLLTSKSILIVDDEPLVVKAVSTYLKKGGFHSVVGLTDPRLTLDALREHRPDMLLLDIVMPGITGLEILEKIERSGEFRDTIILMLSAAGQEDENLSYELGALGFIKKPARPEDVVRIISSTLRIANRFGTR